jgi:hypothetical protein
MPNLTPYDWFRMTDQAYDKNTSGHVTEGLPEGWRSVNISDKYLSGYAGTVFVNTTTKEIVMSHRGTEKSLLDVMADLKIVEGRVPLQVARPDMIIEKLMAHKTFSQYTISHTGHSLGGYIAEYLGLKYKQKVVSFDAPPNTNILVQLNLTLNKDLKSWAKDNITAYKIDTTFTNFVPRSYGTSIQINQAAAEKAGFGSSHGRDNIVQFFDKKTGQIRSECFENELTKTPIIHSAQQGAGYNNMEINVIKPLTYQKTIIEDTTIAARTNAKTSTSDFLSSISQRV